MSITVLNTILGVFALFAQLLGVALLITLWRFPQSELARLVNKYALWLVFGTAAGAMVMSLVYSEILHYPPCTLCWYQRILMYPIVFLLGRAIIKKDRGILPYAQVLAAIGAPIALYHHFLQFNLVPTLPCAAQGVSCSVRFVLEFGYITFPLMSCTAFVLILLFISTSKRFASSVNESKS